MKKLLFTLCLMATTLFYSCSSDDNNDTDPNPIVPTTTGAISNNGVNFNNKDLKVESAIIAKSQLKSTFVTTYLNLLFNDNVQVVIEANIDEGTTIPINDVYYTYIKYATKVTFNLLNNNTIVKSESFTDDAKIKNMYNDNLNALTLNFKNEYEYKGEITLPETPEIEVPEIVQINKENIAKILHIPNDKGPIFWECKQDGFFEGSINFQEYESNPFYLRFNTTYIDNSMISHYDDKFDISFHSISVSFTNNGFYFKLSNKITYDEITAHYKIISMTTNKIEMVYDYYDRGTGSNQTNIGRKFILNKIDRNKQ
ncbi:MAG: hypothetical protein LBV71_12810 [Prevotella sp.]|nr:hypothetical protein [Prevotella sp.]